MGPLLSLKDVEAMDSSSRRPCSVARVGESDSPVAASDHRAPVSESWKSLGSSFFPVLDLICEQAAAGLEGGNGLKSMFVFAVQSGDIHLLR